MGAGDWHSISGGNYFFHDEAKMGDTLICPWFYGSLQWHIVIGWKDSGAADSTMRILPNQQYNQTFTMSNQGCLRVSKYQYWAERWPDGTRNKSDGMR